MAIDPADRALLLQLARQSIADGCGRPAPAAPPALPGLSVTLCTPRASFVTLRLAGLLRGCRGSIKAEHPLAHDVWENAWSSAYDDPRFPPLAAADAAAVEIGVSVLSALEPVPATTRRVLLGQIEPGRHGLVVAAGPHRATFLPQVWDTLSSPDEFLDRLLAKSGQCSEPWSPVMQAWRYTVESFGTVP